MRRILDRRPFIIVPEDGLSGGIETRFDANTDGNTTAAKLNGGGGIFAWHLDAAYKDGEDYEIPGFAESVRLRALEGAGAGEGARGSLPGSRFESTAAAGRSCESFRG